MHAGMDGSDVGSFGIGFLHAGGDGGCIGSLHAGGDGGCIGSAGGDCGRDGGSIGSLQCARFERGRCGRVGACRLIFSLRFLLLALSRAENSICKSGDILWWTCNVVEAQAKAAVLDFFMVEDFCSAILF